MNNTTAHILHEFVLDVPPVNVKEITCLTVWIVDQEGRLTGKEITLRLHLRPKKK